MMFSGQKVSYPLGFFRWKGRGESSLTRSLLNDVPPEIELSDYGRVPSPGSESPSGLLNGESINAEPIADLDLFFERLYNYYCGKGLWCIIIKWIVELLTLGFIICVSGFLFLYVDYIGLRKAKCGMNAVESGIKPCDLAKEAIHEHPLTPFTLSKAIIVGYLGLFSIYWIFCFLRFFAQLKVTLGIRHFYYDSLQVTDNEIQTMPWATILEKVVQLQSSQRLCVVKELSTHDVVMRLMRKENYLIGMLNKGVLAFPIFPWVPGTGPIVKVASNGTQHRLILTKTFEWTLTWCILQSMFDRNSCVRRDFIDNPRMLKKRLVIVGLIMLLLSPFLVIFMLVYFFLRHAEQIYKNPSTASSRRWSNLSNWIFREFNEVDHLFKHRINSSVVHASDYLKQFPCPIISIIAKFICFVAGGFAAILIIIAVLEESLLEAHIFGRNLLWYTAVFGAIIAISRAAVADELLVLDPEGAMSMVVQHTHFMPKRWRGKENAKMVQLEFESLFQYTIMMLLEDMASIFFTPYLLLFVVPKRVDDILQFIANFTVHVEGVGHVCSFSNFDFQSHGNSKYGSPQNAPPIQRSSQGKLEKSFLSFQSSYPSWEPNAQGKHFLSNLRTFREQNLKGTRTRHTNFPPRIWRGSLNLRGYEDRIRNSFLFRETPQSTPGRPVNHSCSLLPTDADQNQNPYLLDLYYTSRPHHQASGYSRDQAGGYLRDVPTLPPEVPEPHLGDYLMQNEPIYKETWENGFEGREQSHLQATTSAPFTWESVLHHHESTNPTRPARTHWWDRTDSHAAHPQASFLDPPDFNLYNTDNHEDCFSEKSSGDQFLDWRQRRNLSDSIRMLDLEAGGDVSLLFDDI